MTERVVSQGNGAANHRQSLRPEGMLATLLLVLLTGLPQIGITLSGMEFGGERLTSVPLTRSLLLDKLLPEACTLSPPSPTEFPPALTAGEPLPYLLPACLIWEEGDAKPSPWRLDLTFRLYRHHSAYV